MHPSEARRKTSGKKKKPKQQKTRIKNMPGKQRKLVKGKKKNHKCLRTKVTSSTRVKFKRFKILLAKILTLFHPSEQTGKTTFPFR